MTVGGKTMGNATVVCTKGFSCDDVRASHHAIGVLMTISITVVMAAS
jgi:hypothetical protein